MGLADFVSQCAEGHAQNLVSPHGAWFDGLGFDGLGLRRRGVVGWGSAGWGSAGSAFREPLVRGSTCGGVSAIYFGEGSAGSPSLFLFFSFRGPYSSLYMGFAA